jgi:trk system potassium uptake protein TrkA
MRAVILGCGRVGSTLARTLDKEGHKVCIIDCKSEAFRRLGHDFGGQTVLGWGLDTDVLTQAGLREADAFAAVTEGDNRNIMSALIAREEFQVPEVVVRIYDPRRAEIYRNYKGIKTISTTQLVAQRVHSIIVKDEPITSLSVADDRHRVLEMVVGKNIEGKKIRTLPLPEDALVSALIRDGSAFMPLSDTVLQDGDRLIIVTKPEVIAQVEVAFRNGSG